MTKIGLLTIIAAALLLGGCGDTTGVEDSQGSGHALKYSEMKDKDAILISHHYPKAACDQVQREHPEFVMAFTTTAEVHCSDYGRTDNKTTCGESDFRSVTGINFVSDCITAADDTRSGKYGHSTAREERVMLEDILFESL